MRVCIIICVVLCKNWLVTNTGGDLQTFLVTYALYICKQLAEVKETAVCAKLIESMHTCV